MISQLFMGLNQFGVKKCREDLLGAVSIGKVYHSIENGNQKKTTTYCW